MNFKFKFLEPLKDIFSRYSSGPEEGRLILLAEILAYNKSALCRSFGPALRFVLELFCFRLLLFTLYWIAFRGATESYPVYSVNRTARGGTSHSHTSNIAPLNSSPHSWIFTFVSVGSSPRFFLFTSATGRIDVHTAQTYGTMPLILSVVCKRALPFLQTRFDFRHPLAFGLVPPQEETSAGSFPKQRLVIEHTPRLWIHRFFPVVT